MCSAGLLLAAVGTGVAALGQVVAYEATSFPDTDGWERVINCLPERAVGDGVLSQGVKVGQCHPTAGDMDAYTRSLSDFDGAPEFFVEFQMHTSADRSELDGGRPTFVDPWSAGPVDYHFTIVRDRVEFFRDVSLPFILVDVAPEAFHTYRLELRGSTTYRFFVDGILADEGVPEGPYPQHSPAINFGAEAYKRDSSAWWKYLRYGVIPLAASGDFDSDEDVDLYDFYFVHECLSNGAADTDAGPGCRFADMDSDTDVDLADFAEFQVAFTGNEP